MPLPQLFKLPYDRVSPKDKERYVLFTSKRLIKAKGHSYTALPTLLLSRGNQLSTVTRAVRLRFSPRWPVVLTNVISAVSNANHEISMSSSADKDAKVAEGKKIISQISEMKYEMGHNALLR